MLNKFPNSIYIQLKNLVFNNYNSTYELEDYLIKFKKIEIKYEETQFHSSFYISDLKKINTNRFVLFSSCYFGNGELVNDLYIIAFDIYNFHDTNLFVRYYSLIIMDILV